MVGEKFEKRIEANRKGGQVMDARQEGAFWETIKIFDDKGLLPYIMLVGSWAEYIYSYYFKTGFMPNLRTRDIDFLYENIHRPRNKINITNALIENGYSYVVHPTSGVGKFIKEDLLELEFLTRTVGSGTQHVYEIPSIGIKAEGLRIINMLSDYPLKLDCGGFIVTVPEPAAYVLQKLLANPTRIPQYKKEKDIDAVRALLIHIKQSEYDSVRIEAILNKLTLKSRRTVEFVCKEQYIEL